jgi:PiT family inorganic phosphate transporter
MLISAGLQDSGSGPQVWVIITCAVAIALGTYMGGWRIIRTLGAGLTEVKPAQGFAAETSTAATILASSHLGFALSTTQVASGSVIGSGLGRKGSSVRWRTAGRIGLGWAMTLPASAIVGALAAFVATIGPVGIAIDLALGLGVIITIFLLSRRNRVDSNNAISEVDAAAIAVRSPKATRRKRKAVG